ncbi:MAG: hypothetical protein DRQ40_00475 [Gammaproteobacteria bacterium]|nr:MAG: hypothetical protein DRQ40_00475 [Gammaproteobacteria bacterium]
MARHWAKTDSRTFFISKTILTRLVNKAIPFTEIYAYPNGTVPDGTCLCLTLENTGYASRDQEYYLIKDVTHYKIRNKGRRVDVYTRGKYYHKCSKVKYSKNWFLLRVI